MVEIDYGVDDSAASAESSAAVTKAAVESAIEEVTSVPASKLDKAVQDLIDLIFDTKMMEATVVAMEYDVRKNPLGKLTESQVHTTLHHL